MAGSQLKRLKASLRDQGIVGPQKSKKQKRKAAEEARAKGTEDKRLRKSAALETIREQFNPFQFKMNARGPKFPVTSLKSQKEGLRGIQGRPAVALSRSEEKRRATLLIDMQRRNKVGGILDRRLGEGDPNMTPEERALERFAFEKQRTHNKKGAVFDLEDDFGEGEGLTHMGRSLALDDEDDNATGDVRDDFDEADLPGSDDEDGEMGYKKLKRMRSELLGEDEDEEGAGAGGAAAGTDGAPERKKTKKEVMEEVIAKSKFHKYERQVAREADDEERAELDRMLPELQQLLARPAPKDAASKANSSKQNGASLFDKETIEKDYDVRLRQMILDKKAEPSTRTKTEEELAEEQSAHLKKLEESRIKRMLGEIEPDEEESDEDKGKGKNNRDNDNGPAVQFLNGDADEEDEFNLGQGIRVRHTAAELGFDDEDDFLIDDDLVASGSEPESVDESDDGGDDDDEFPAAEDSDLEDDEFTRGLLTEEEKKDPLFLNSGKLPSSAAKGNDDDGVPYTFPCPQTHAELLEVVRDIPVAKLPVVVQRIRALYHPKLDHGNKERLGRFAAALVKHVAYLANQNDAPYATIESLVRHIHSLAKMVPIDVANAFREHLAEVEGAGPFSDSGSNRALSFNSGDLAILTAVTLFPTSDHFHQVVTPSMLAMARYLEQKIPHTLSDYATGLYVCTLFLQYQQLSKRYVPELVNFVLNTLLSLAPAACDDKATLCLFPVHAPARGVRITESAREVPIRKLRPADCRKKADTREVVNHKDGHNDDDSLKVALLSTGLALLAEATALWADKPALYETLVPVRAVLQHLQTSKRCRAALSPQLNQEVDRLLGARVEAAQRLARLARRPLELHHHRPVAIRAAVPRFEDEFDPDKHYDPDRARAEAAKLQAELKRERKGALRELRKDAGFLQREKLKLKKARDAAYEKKYKRLVAEIQGSEGQAANAYERERQARRRK